MHAYYYDTRPGGRVVSRELIVIKTSLSLFEDQKLCPLTLRVEASLIPLGNVEISAV